METTGVVQSGGCPYCSSESVQVYHGGTCPRVKAIEYYPDGTIRKVEFVIPLAEEVGK